MNKKAKCETEERIKRVVILKKNTSKILLEPNLKRDSIL